MINKDHDNILTIKLPEEYKRNITCTMMCTPAGQHYLPFSLTATDSCSLCLPTASGCCPASERPAAPPTTLWYSECRRLHILSVIIVPPPTLPASEGRKTSQIHMSQISHLPSDAVSTLAHFLKEPPAWSVSVPAGGGRRRGHASFRGG